MLREGAPIVECLEPLIFIRPGPVMAGVERTCGAEPWPSVCRIDPKWDLFRRYLLMVKIFTQDKALTGRGMLVYKESLVRPILA